MIPVTVSTVIDRVVDIISIRIQRASSVEVAVALVELRNEIAGSKHLLQSFLDNAPTED